MPEMTLSLLRHAKSSWDNPDLDDADRPLTERGTKAAHKMGRFMAEAGLKPDLVLCSPAIRTRATLTLVLDRMEGTPPPVVFPEQLYMASSRVLVDAVRALADEDKESAESRPSARSVLVVGHNPGLHGFALELIGKGERDDIRTLATGFPTCALAVIDFKMKTWGSLRAGLGTLRLYRTPRARHD